MNENLMNFINSTPNAYYGVQNIKNYLCQKGFIQIYENEDWHKLKEGNNYFVIRNDSSIIAFKLRNNNGFNIVASHLDSPSFKIKVNADMSVEGVNKLNVERYGGTINYSWLDRPLSIAGRIFLEDKRGYHAHLINFDEDLAIIPSQAIHINREVNEGIKLNEQIDMSPIISLQNMSLQKLIENKLKKEGIIFEKICDYDLYLYNRDKAKYIGANKEFILGPRFDNLATTFISLESFTNSYNKTSAVFCAFNNEEIGSLTYQGADSHFLLDTLTRICEALNTNFYTTLNNSFMISADNGHALHPNAQEKSDPTNHVLLNRGVVIKHHTNYTTDALSSTIFKGICEKAGAMYQDFTCRSDMQCGKTLGGISNSHISIPSIDIGLPQLAMHSANETIGAWDINEMYKALKGFYNAEIIMDKDTINIK